MSQADTDIADLLRATPVFAGLDTAQLAALAATGELVNARLGESLCRQGEPGDAAYLVFSGRVRVVRDGTTLAVLERGEFAGEAAILADGPRNATLRAAADSVLVRFEREPFRQYCQAHPELAAYFDSLRRDRGLLSFLRSDTILREVPPAQLRRLLEELSPCRYARGECVLEQGQPGQGLFIVRRGAARVSGGHNGAVRPLALLGQGEHFGELSLLSGQPCAATVTAEKELECLTLSREAFERVTGEVPKLRRALLERAEKYRLDGDAAVRPLAPEAVPSPPAELEFAPAPEQEPPAVPAGRRRFPWVRQHDAADCGAACLAMLARFHGRRLPLARLRDQANVGRSGASLFSLAHAAEAIGFTCRAVRTDLAHLRQLELPAIAHWDGFHYVVVYAANAGRVVVGDPAIGIRKLDPAEFERHWTGHLLQLSPTPALAEQPETQTTLGRFLPLLQPYRWLLGEILLASLLINLFGLATPVFTQIIIDKVVVHQDVPMLNMMLAGMLLVGVFLTLTSLLRRYLLNHVSQKLSLRLSSDLFRQIMRLPMRYFATRQVGDTITRFADNRKVQELMTSSALNTLLDVTMVLVYLLVMLAYSAKLTAVAFLFIPLSVAITVLYTPVLKRNNQALFERQAATQSRLIEAVEKVAAIKSAAAELATRWHYEDLLVRQANQAFRSAHLGMGMDVATRAIQLLSTTVVLWYGAHLVIAGELSVGQLIAFNVLIGMVMAPVLGLVNMWQRLQDALLSLQRLSDIYDAEPEEPAGATRIELPPLRGEIRFENVSFRYAPDAANVLSNIDFTVEPGQTVAVVGRSGSGKTTLISLLQRLLRPTEGRVLIDGIDIAAASTRSLRSQLGVVMQEAAIFSGSIRENIEMGLDQVSGQAVIEAAQLANAHDFIMRFPQGYDTHIGEVGVNLSGGQRQRICIARALLRQPRIIVFDEATSALDSESERAIQQNMHAILADRSALVIAHRLSTIRNADRILVLDDGRLVENGTHDELIERQGLYYYLNAQQLAA